VSCLISPSVTDGRRGRILYFSNVLLRDSSDPATPGFLKSSAFGHAVTTAGGVFGSGGPRAFQLAARVTF
jgi:hypothetical protein